MLIKNREELNVLRLNANILKSKIYRINLSATSTFIIDIIIRIFRLKKKYLHRMNEKRALNDQNLNNRLSILIFIKDDLQKDLISIYQTSNSTKLNLKQKF